MMNTPEQLLECVANFSEGRDVEVIEQIVSSIDNVEGTFVLHVDRSPSANRTVITFAGTPNEVITSAYNAIEKAAELIDMRRQEGVHPRIGATDVCPLIPLKGISIEETIALSRQLGEKVGAELNIPIYLYEYSAREAYRKALPTIRKGQYDGFAKKMKEATWQPDYGPQLFNEQTGATVIGARDILVAFNISLNTKDERKAQYIASRIRESGYINPDTKERAAGRLKKLRAIGWYMSDFECAQVSMNLLDYRVTSPLKVWNASKELASEVGVELVGSELIGLMPEACLLEAGGWKQGDDKEVILQKGIDYLGLDKVKPFTVREKILEYRLEEVGLI
ncbi:MAG: glutamate formimidoyltransferase [Flavipsychrobacter sp.]